MTRLSPLLSDRVMCFVKTVLVVPYPVNQMREISFWQVMTVTHFPDVGNRDPFQRLIPSNQVKKQKET